MDLKRTVIKAENLISIPNVNTFSLTTEIPIEYDSIEILIMEF